MMIFTRALAVMLALSVFFALTLGGWTHYPKGLSQFRNPLIGVSVLFGLGLFVLYISRGRSAVRSFFTLQVQQWNPNLLRKIMFCVFSAAFLKATLLDYLAVTVHALDGSIYDYAMMNTLRGRFMESVNGTPHFGIHATPILFLLLPFHALFHSPLFVLILHPLALLFGAWLFDRVMAKRKIGDWTRLALLLAYLSSIWISRTLHYSFHVEIFYPIAVFLIDLTLARSASFWLSALFFLSIKEDAPFHLIALMGAYALTKRTSWRRTFITTFISLGVAALYLKVIIPMNNAVGEYRFVGSAEGAGDTLPKAIQYLFAHPLYVVQRYLAGAWTAFLVPSLGLLLASPFFWVASLPLLGLYSLAGNSQAYSLTIYYAIPLVGVFFLSLAEGYSKTSGTRRTLSTLSVLIAFTLFGSGYLVFRRAEIAQWLAMRERLAMLPPKTELCASEILVPQLPYGNIRLINEECLEGAEYAVLPTESSELPRYPLSATEEQELRKKLKQWTRLDNPQESLMGTYAIEIFQKPTHNLDTTSNKLKNY